MEFAGPFRSDNLSRDTNALENVQRRSAQFSYRTVRQSYEARLKLSGPPSLKVDLIVLGDSNKLKKEGSNFSRAKSSFPIECPVHSNSLPDEVVSTRLFNIFKNNTTFTKQS